MRTLMKITVPVTAGNKAISDGSLPRVIQTTMETLKPEGAFFSTADGKRTAWLFFDLKDVSQMPVICEPLFTTTDAPTTAPPSASFTTPEIDGSANTRERRKARSMLLPRL